MEEKILEICRYLCCSEISMNEQLIVSGRLDSFKIMELICSLEEEFHITFSAEEISDTDNFSCVYKIANIVKRKVKEMRD